MPDHEPYDQEDEPIDRATAAVDGKYLVAASELNAEELGRRIADIARMRAEEAEAKEAEAAHEPPTTQQPCPNCGKVHGVSAWQPDPRLNIDRDITAIVMAILNDGTLRDFAELVGDERRATLMLLRSCQYVAQLHLALAGVMVVNSEHPPESEEEMAIASVLVAKDALQRALISFAEGGTGLTTDEEEGP